MHRGIVVLAGLVVAGGCGDDPVASTPLAGELNGVAWTAGGAVARRTSDEGERSVHMHPDVDLTCAGAGDEPYVAAVLPWTVGAQEIGLQSDAIVFIYFDATAHLVLDGRIEVLAAPTAAGETAPFRIRASFVDGDDDLFVEGEITVQICE